MGRLGRHSSAVGGLFSGSFSDSHNDQRTTLGAGFSCWRRGASAAKGSPEATAQPTQTARNGLGPAADGSGRKDGGNSGTSLRGRNDD